VRNLAERLLAVDRALSEAGLEHAFGGAIALAYCTREPRGTQDIDVNVFVDVDRADEVLDALPGEVRVTEVARSLARRDGQVRVFWKETPVDIFLDTHEFQRDAAARVVQVPFDSGSLPVLACDDLARFKALYNRTRDWADLEAMVEAGAIDGTAVLDDLRAVLGVDDPAVVRLAEIVA
jgi:hypothetical protein